MIAGVTAFAAASSRVGAALAAPVQMLAAPAQPLGVFPQTFGAPARPFGAPAQAPVVPATNLGAPATLTGTANLDPGGQIRKPLLAGALTALEAHRARLADASRIFIADMTRHSSQPRLYQLDMNSGEVRAFRTAHGRGSDPERSGYARKFSNTPNSNATSLGAYVTLGVGHGVQHGVNVGLDGLEVSNNAARERAIIVHSADYCEPAFLRAFGMLGRSQGCFAVSEADFRTLLPMMADGRLLFAGA